MLIKYSFQCSCVRYRHPVSGFAELGVTLQKGRLKQQKPSYCTDTENTKSKTNHQESKVITEICK